MLKVDLFVDDKVYAAQMNLIVKGWTMLAKPFFPWVCGAQDRLLEDYNFFTVPSFNDYREKAF